MKSPDNLYYKKYRLGSDLDRYVKYVWVMKSEGKQSEKDLLIPDGYSEIIFVQKGAYQKKFLNEPDKNQIIDQSCIVGIQTQSVLANRINSCQFVGIKLTPLGAYILFGSHLKNIFNTNYPIAQLSETWLINLDKQLKAQENEKTIFEIISKQLLHQINASKNHPNFQLAEAYLNSVIAVEKKISIQKLAAKHFVSIRQFQRNFKNFFGVTPKVFLNIIRFKQLYKSSVLQTKSPENYLNFGYYDQMHFIKDFRRHLGITPSKSLNETFVQMNKMARS